MGNRGKEINLSKRNENKHEIIVKKKEWKKEEWGIEEK